VAPIVAPIGAQTNNCVIVNVAPIRLSLSLSVQRALSLTHKGNFSKVLPRKINVLSKSGVNPMKYYALLDPATKKTVKFFRCDDDLRSENAMLTEDRKDWLSVPAPVDLISGEGEGITYKWLEEWQMQAIIMSRL